MFSDSGVFSWEDYFEKFLADALVGAIAVIGIFILALLLGGFSFIQPWFLVTPPLMFAAGMARGRGEGNLWIKCLSISVGTLLFLCFFTNTNALTVLSAMLTVLLSTASGVWFRRHRLSKKK